MKADTYQLADVVEAADLLRAAIAGARRPIPAREWEEHAAAYAHTYWFTDCRNAYDTLQKPVSKAVDKILGIELASLRQHLWRQAGERLPDRRNLEEKPKKPSDTVKWIDTAVMIADCLTKQMEEDALHAVVTSNVWNFEQTTEAKATKQRKQAQRRKTQAEEEEGELNELEPDTKV